MIGDFSIFSITVNFIESVLCN